MSSPFIGAKEAAARAHLSIHHFHRLQAAGLTPAINANGKRGMKVLYTPEAIDRWIVKRSKAAK